MAQVTTRRPGRILWIVLVLVVCAGAAASGSTARGQDILTAVQRFLLFYSGVVALVALTTAVGVGIVAADRIVMTPSRRVLAQAVHRAVSLAALGFLITHIVLEIVAHRSHVIDAFIPFLARGRTFYIGLGTIASDLIILLIVSGLSRARFADRWPWTWRAIHLTAYLCWPFAIVHGLLAGRTAKPYVDWSYGACLAAAGLAIIIRLVATLRSRNETARHPLPERSSAPVQPAMNWMPADRRGYEPRPAISGEWPTGPRALPPGVASAGQPRPPYPRMSARPHAPHPDNRDHPSGQWHYSPEEFEPEPDTSAYPSYRDGR